MNCDRVHEELELSFGARAISAEVAEHLGHCEACRAYHEELLSLMSDLGEDENVGISPAAIEQTIRAVERRIAPARPTSITTSTWVRPLLRFAAAAAVVLFAYGAYQLGLMQSGGSENRSATGAASAAGNLVSMLQSDVDTSMDDNMVSVLIDEYSSGASLGASEALIGDITEDEMKYLEKNFEVGDLL